MPDAAINQTYTTVYGGVAAKVPANSVADILKVDGVAAVQKDTLNQPQDDNTDFIGAKAVWPSLGGSIKAGSNVIVGVIDTGVWPENPMLSPTGISSPTTGNPPWGCQFGDGSDVAHLGPTVRVQQEADRRVRVHDHVHGERRLRRAGVLQQHDRKSARRATPRVTARTR